PQHPEILKNFLKYGVFYEKLQTQLLPCLAIEGDGNVTQLILTDIPFKSEAELRVLLTEGLKKYGEVLDVSLLKESRKGWFMGNGKATLYRPKNKEFQELKHTLDLGKDEYCHATFPDMKTWCRYCHGEDHTKFNCKKANARVLCFACDEHGHKAADCPTSTEKKNK
ncbi:hypothetical protein BD770DRAFT_297847, partial [Pilaira anomala]